MDMDPLTRREADKIESVLDDLITELELVSFLPEEFNLWLRDDIVPTVEQSSLLESLRQKYKKLMKKLSPQNKSGFEGTSGTCVSNNGEHKKCKDNIPFDFNQENDNAYVKSSYRAYRKQNHHHHNNNNNIDNKDEEVDEDDECSESVDDNNNDNVSEDNDDVYHDEEELQRLMKAMCFVHAAAHYGDPADCINNEALTQVTDFNEIERELLETATTLGHVESGKLQFHHLCTRALVDLLRNGFYNIEMQKLLAVCYPANTINSQADKYNDDDNDNNCNMSNRVEQNGSNSRQQKWSAFSENVDTRATTTTTTSLFSSSSKQPVLCNEEKWQGKATSVHDVKLEYNEEWARSNGVIDKSSSHLKEIMTTLAKLIKLRNTFTVNEDVHRYKVLHEAIHKEQSASADVQALNREYEEAKLMRQQEVSELDAEIENLELELNEMQADADRALDALNAAHAHVVNERLHACNTQRSQHEVECNTLAEQLKRVQGKHVEEINALRNMRTKKEAAVSGAISEYDSQMSHLHEMISEFQRDAESNSGKVVRVEEQLATLAAEKAEYELEQRVAAQRKNHAEQLAQKMENDVRVIQAYYRAYLVRKNVERKMNKRTKKSKKRSASVKKNKST